MFFPFEVMIIINTWHISGQVWRQPDTLHRTIMADKRARKKEQLPSMDQLLGQAKEILDRGSRAKKRKPVHYEFSTDPVTGFRNCKGTYSAKSNSARRGRNQNLDDSADNSQDIHNGKSCSISWFHMNLLYFWERSEQRRKVFYSNKARIHSVVIAFFHHSVRLTSFNESMYKMFG